METSSPVSDERNISPKERASQAFEEFMGAWGTWRESHSHRMDAFRLMHREYLSWTRIENIYVQTSGDTERKLKIQRSALDEACPRGAQVICEDVSTEGMSLRLEGVPRGNANADRRETTTTELTHDDVFDHARKLHSTMEEAFLSGRNFGGNLDECTYRGPLGFEASADDFLGFMATLLEMIDAEYDSQSAFLADMKIAQTRQQLYDLELQVVESALSRT